MMNWNAWFRTQLHSSAEGLLWAFAQIPSERYGSCPPAPHYLGTWPPARHLWHVLHYERCLVIPSMRQWIDQVPAPSDSDWPDDDVTWAAAWAAGVADLPAQFQSTREEQMQLLDVVRPADWQTMRTTIWGEKPLSMVVTKTYQHTLEHCDTLLRMALWWDDAERDIAARRAKQQLESQRAN
jgi:hypothetical protein